MKNNDLKDRIQSEGFGEILNVGEIKKPEYSEEYVKQKEKSVKKSEDRTF